MPPQLFWSATFLECPFYPNAINGHNCQRYFCKIASLSATKDQQYHLSFLEHLLFWNAPFSPNPINGCGHHRYFCKATSVATKDFLKHNIQPLQVASQGFKNSHLFLLEHFPPEYLLSSPDATTSNVNASTANPQGRLIVFVDAGGKVDCLLTVQCNNQLVPCQFIVASCCLFAASCCCGICYCQLIAAFLPSVAHAFL